MEHPLGEGNGLGTEEVEVLAHVLAFDGLEHARDQRKKCLPLALDFFQPRALRGLQGFAAAYQARPGRIVDRQIGLVLVFEEFALRGDIAAQPREHGEE